MGKCCCVFLILIVAAIILGVSIGVPLAVKKGKHAVDDLQGDASNLACEATSYPATCNSTLSGGNATDSKSVTKLSLQSANTGVNQTWEEVLLLNGTNLNFTYVVEICEEVLGLAEEQLTAALASIESLNDTARDDTLNDVKAWVSGAMELHTTCVDAALELVSNAGVVLQEKAAHTDELLSNALALINALAQYGDNLTKWKNTAFSFLNSGFSVPPIPGVGNRRLLSERSSADWMSETNAPPAWMDAQSQRHLLATPTYDVKVAQDGSGDFKSIQDAVDAHDENSNRLVIYVTAGTYTEQVIIPKKAKYLTIIGDGDDTVITGSRSVALTSGMTTFKSATLIVSGVGFIARSLKVENTAGALGHQAVAVRVSADQVAFYQVTIDSYQDTLYAHTFRQYYRECTISGTVDFIFGNGAVSFQSCTILAKKTTLQGQQNTYSAQGRTDPHQSTGLAFQNCTFDGTPELKANTTYYKTYLGRPWKPYSVCVLLKNDLLGHIDPTGWLPWNTSTYGLYTSYFAEYQSFGAGGSSASRVSWSHQIGTASTANKYVANNFVQASSWVPTTNIPLTTSL